VLRVLRYLPRWSLIAFAALVVLSATVGLAAPARLAVLQGGTGIGVDPLSPDEMLLAQQQVQQVRGVQTASIRTSVPLVPGQTLISAPAEETVLVERHEEEKSTMAAGVWERKADVYTYRYADDTLLYGIYNFATGEVVSQQEVKGVQFPLTDAERALAVEMLFADPAALTIMRDEYRRITGRELTAVEQVDTRVFVYHAGSNPEIEPPDAASCGMQRCAQVMILADDNVTFDVLPIVNLSTLRVVSLIPVAVESSISPAGSDPAGGAGHDHRGTP
jgi:hypothetical protein